MPVTACIPSPRATPLRACSLLSSALGPHNASPPGTYLCSCSDQTMLFKSMQRGAHRKDLSHPALRAWTQRTQQDRDQQAHTAHCGDPELAQQNDFKSSAETSQRELYASPVIGLDLMGQRGCLPILQLLCVLPNFSFILSSLLK